MLTLLVSMVTSQVLTAQSLKVYRGKDGQRVEVVALAPQQPGKGSNPNALVRVTGSGSERDGLVFRGTQREQGRSFVMRYGGHDWVLTTNRDGEVDVSMPGRTESFRVKYDEASTTAANKDEVVKVHLSQVADDSIALAEKAEWPNIVAKYEKKDQEGTASRRLAIGEAEDARVRVLDDGGGDAGPFTRTSPARARVGVRPADGGVLARVRRRAESAARGGGAMENGRGVAASRRVITGRSSRRGGCTARCSWAKSARRR